MVSFISEDISATLKGKRIISGWFNKVLIDNGLQAGEINIIFCSESYLLNLNRESLSHNYHTDIITFNYREDYIVSGDLFISLPMVKSNSEKYPQLFSPNFECELCRVMIHGILHIIGYDDVTPYKKKKMRQAENEALMLLEKEFSEGRISVSF